MTIIYTICEVTEIFPSGTLGLIIEHFGHKTYRQI